MYYDRLDVISAVRCLESEFTFHELGKMYGVNKSLFWYASHGKVYPGIRDALGMWPAIEPRHRRAGEFTAERIALYDAMLAELGTSTTEILNGILDRWLETQK